MTTNNKEEAKKRTEMLANLRKQHREQVKVAQALLKEQQSMRKLIGRTIQGEPKTVPQISEATGIPSHEVLWHLTAMKKYSQVIEDGLDEDYEYYLYKLSPEAKS